MSANHYPMEKILSSLTCESRIQNNPVANALVAFWIQIQYDKDSGKFYSELDELSEEKVGELREKVRSLINAKLDGEAETLKLQITYELSHIQEEDKIEKLKQYFDKELNNILKEITQTPSSKKESESFQIHKKIFNFLLIKTKQNTLNSLTECDNSNIGTNAEKEIYVALDNIFPKSGWTPFWTLSIQDKIAQLNELANTIMGLRWWNCELGKGGLGLMTLDDIKKKLKFELWNDVKKLYTTINNTAESYSLIYSNIEIGIINEAKDWEILNKIRKMNVYYRQILTYLSMLIDDLNWSIQTKDQLIMSYENEKNTIIYIIGKQSSVSKDKAYPLFQNLAKMYAKFQEQVFILNIRQNVFDKLVEFINEKQKEFIYDDNLLREESKPQEQSKISWYYNKDEWEDRFQIEVEKLDIYLKQDEPVFSFESGAYPNNVTILWQNSTAEYLNWNLEFQGFCIVTLLEMKGLLVSGRPAVVVKYKDKYMVFNNHQCVQKFITNPQKYLDDLYIYARENPYLINLLNITEEFPQCNLANWFRDKESNIYQYKSSKVLENKGIQTVTHIYENGFVDPNYVWNEWDLKKKALQLADIMNKRTISCQTLLSHFRRENETQVYPLKDSEVNTTVNKGTNLSIPKSYAANFKKNSNKY